MQSGLGQSSCKGFSESKISSKILVHFGPKLPLILATDASAYGLGTIISHKCMDGSECLVAFASRVLTKAERNYSQLALSIIYSIKKFHQFLFGWKFKLIADHKPLTTILGPKTGGTTNGSCMVAALGYLVIHIFFYYRLS